MVLRVCFRFCASILMLLSSTTAFADTISDGESTAARRGRLTELLLKVVAAGQEVVAKTSADSDQKPDDLRDAQTQLARMVQFSGRCGDSISLLERHPEILAASIKLILVDAREVRDQGCATRLAALMATRWDDPYYTPEGRLGVRYNAGAYLRAGADSSGILIMREAEQKLREAGAIDTLWDARFQSLEAYHQTKLWTVALEEFARNLEVEHDSPSSIRDGALLLFATEGRCDLVEQVVKAGSRSCDKWLSLIATNKKEALGTCPILGSPNPADRGAYYGTLVDDGIEKALNQRALSQTTGLLVTMARRIREQVDCVEPVTKP